MSLASWMFKQRLPPSVRSASGADMLIIMFSFVAIHWIYLDSMDFTAARFVVLFSVLGFAYVIFAGFGLYRMNRGQFLHELIVRLTIAWFVIGLLVSLVAFLSKIAVDISRLWFTSSMILSYLLLVGLRLVSGFVLATSHMKGKDIQFVVLIGRKTQTDRVLRRLRENPWTGYQVSRVFSNIQSQHLQAEAALDEDGQTVAIQTLNEQSQQAQVQSVQSLLDEIHTYIEQQRQSDQPIVEVWVSLPLSEQALIEQLLRCLQDASVDVCLLPDPFGMQFYSGTTSNIAELPVVNISDVRLHGSAELFKRLFDRVVALLAIALLMPVMLCIAAAIKLDSRGPVMFRQLRYGMDGREIEIWKFRSMSVQEQGGIVRQATRADSRVTHVGAFLRRHSLDELPQFFNVLQGRMSIVGPRPHAVSHNEEYRKQINGYMLRHKIKPGITGWAQVNGWRGETDTLDKMEKRVRYDLEYIQNWSAWLDIKIILMTLFQGFVSKDVY